MTEKFKQILTKSPTNDKNIFCITQKVGKFTKQIGTLDLAQKVLLITKSQRKYSRKLEAFGVPFTLLDCSSLLYDKIFVETKRKLYCISRSFWKWNGTIIHTPIKQSYLHLDNFRIVSKRGKYAKQNTISS